VAVSSFLGVSWAKALCAIMAPLAINTNWAAPTAIAVL
jgi:hypothetical protein